MTSSRTVGILVDFNYEDLELWYPYYRLKEEGFTVITIAVEEGKTYNSKHGYPCKAEKSINEINEQDLVALIVPGGWAPDYLRRVKAMVDLVRDMHTAGKVVAAICHGPWMFCSAKILKGKKTTGFFAIKDDMENAGALYEDSPVVVDDNMITSRTPADLPDFCKAILSKLQQ